MLKIGEFSKLSRVSVRILEVYDDRDQLEQFFSARTRHRILTSLSRRSVIQ